MRSRVEFDVIFVTMQQSRHSVMAAKGDFRA
jgi:hypothetical protein